MPWGLCEDEVARSALLEHEQIQTDCLQLLQRPAEQSDAAISVSVQYQRNAQKAIKEKQIWILDRNT